MIVLDTNIISEVMRPTPEPLVLAWLSQQPATSLAITAITVAEIRYGIRRLPDGKRRNELARRFQIFIERGFAERIIPFDDIAADAYADIVTNRQRIGRPIEAFDAMIAGIARANGATMATRNVADFEACSLLVVNPWNTAGETP